MRQTSLGQVIWLLHLCYLLNSFLFLPLLFSILQLLCQCCTAVFDLHEASHHLPASEISFKSVYFLTVLQPMFLTFYMHLVLNFLTLRVCCLFSFILYFSGWASNDCCLMCELEQHASMLREGRSPLSPSRILSLMRNISSQMGGGDQEDAHEFLRCKNFHTKFIAMKGS